MQVLDVTAGSIHICPMCHWVWTKYVFISKFSLSDRMLDVRFIAIDSYTRDTHCSLRNETAQQKRKKQTFYYNDDN